MAHKSHHPASLAGTNVRGVLAFFVGFALVLGESTSSSSSSLGKRIPQLRQLGRESAAVPRPASFLITAASSSDEPNIIYEDGIVVETVLDETRLGISIYSTLAVPFKDFVYAIDSTASQLLKIRLPIDQSTRARRIAGDGKGRTGYNDGWGPDALLDHPKGLAVDGDGNVYVADVRNHVIRKISEEGYVTTIAGQPNKTGHADGTGMKALFSSDFTLTYLPSTCSLLVSDRGNGRLRIIQLKSPLTCDYGGISSDGVWKAVSSIFGALVIVLSAALGIVLFQKAELQRSVTESHYLDDDESPLKRHQNGTDGSSPYPISRPRLDYSGGTLRRGSSLPSNIAKHVFLDRSNLMDFPYSPSYGEGPHPRTKLLETHGFNSSGDTETDDLQSLSSLGEDNVTRTPIQESMLTGPNDAFSRLLLSNSQLPERRIFIPDEEAERFFARICNGTS